MVSLVWAIVYQLATGIAGLALVAMILLASKCPLGSVEWGLGVEARAMSDTEVHVKAAREKRLAALDEFDRKRFMVVGDLAIRDKVSMWQSWDELFQAVGNLRMDLRVIPETLEEFEAANPVFLEELFKYGKVLASYSFFMCVKVAMTVLLPSMIIVVGFAVSVMSPLQPEKTHILLGLAVNVTLSP